jgi:hypothetical protein
MLMNDIHCLPHKPNLHHHLVYELTLGCSVMLRPIKTQEQYLDKRSNIRSSSARTSTGILGNKLLALSHRVTLVRVSKLVEKLRVLQARCIMWRSLPVLNGQRAAMFAVDVLTD